MYICVYKYIRGVGICTTSTTGNRSYKNLLRKQRQVHRHLHIIPIRRHVGLQSQINAIICGPTLQPKSAASICLSPVASAANSVVPPSLLRPGHLHLSVCLRQLLLLMLVCAPAGQTGGGLWRSLSQNFDEGVTFMRPCPRLFQNQQAHTEW